MPIVSRTLTLLANREDRGPGVKRWRVDATDARGRIWVHGPFFGTQAAGEVVRDAVAFDLAEQDKAELLEWVHARNTVAAFDYTGRDITEAQGEEHVFQWFAESPGAEAITVAWWLDSINTGTFNNILGRVGYTGDQGDSITSRFTSMVTVDPWYDLTIKAPRWQMCTVIRRWGPGWTTARHGSTPTRCSRPP